MKAWPIAPLFMFKWLLGPAVCRRQSRPRHSKVYLLRVSRQSIAYRSNSKDAWNIRSFYFLFYSFRSLERLLGKTDPGGDGA